MTSIICKSDSEDIRIYVDGVLHIRIPRDKDIKIKAYTEGDSKLYLIEIWCANHTSLFQYDNKELWVKILNVLDKHI